MLSSFIVIVPTVAASSPSVIFNESARLFSTSTSIVHKVSSSDAMFLTVYSFVVSFAKLTFPISLVRSEFHISLYRLIVPDSSPVITVVYPSVPLI